VAITASASFEGAWDLEISASTTTSDLMSNWCCYGWFMEADEQKQFVNDLHLQEQRKDVFRQASINPNSIEHSHRIINQNIPAKRNYRGKQSQRI